MNDLKLLESIKTTLSVESESIKQIESTVDKAAILEAIKLLGDCNGRVLVAGCGTSGAAAVKISHSLCCVEIPASYLNPADAVHGGLGRLQKNDVLILISKGGNTKEIISMIPACKTKGAKLIGVTENNNSVLAVQADLLLKVKVDKEPCPFNMLATASTMAVIAVFDAICIALMHYTNYTREMFSIIHPGGAVGDRLLNDKK